MTLGISFAPEDSKRRMDDSLNDPSGIRPIPHDILVLILGCEEIDGETERGHDVKFRALMPRGMERSIKLNRVG